MITANDLRQQNSTLYKRDPLGLLCGHLYSFNKDGSVDWRAMVKPEFLYVNKEWFELRKKQIPTSIDGLTDRQLLILLGGIKDLARLRGYSSVSYSITGDKEHVVATCRIDWIPNFESDDKPIYFEDVANANQYNTDKFCQKFLETIACNRSFVRCVRNFLNINIVGDDEIDKSGKSVSVDSSEDNEEVYAMKPHETLEAAAKEKGIATFEAFVSWLREQWKLDTYKNEDAKIWTEYLDIPAKECRKLLFILTKN
jgi:hypothetical protein